MGNAIPSQHPAVVLRSHYTLVRALLAVAMIAVVGLTIAVVILANESDEVSTSAGSTSVAAPVGTTRYDGGPEEGTRAIGAAAAPPRATAPPPLATTAAPRRAAPTCPRHSRAAQAPAGSAMTAAPRRAAAARSPLRPDSHAVTRARALHSEGPCFALPGA